MCNTSTDRAGRNYELIILTIRKVRCFDGSHVYISSTCGHDKCTINVRLTKLGKQLVFDTFLVIKGLAFTTFIYGTLNKIVRVLG